MNIFLGTLFLGMSVLAGCASADRSSGMADCSNLTREDVFWNRVQDGGSFNSAATNAGPEYCVDFSSPEGSALMNFSVWMEKEADYNGVYAASPQMTERLITTLPEQTVIHHVHSASDDSYTVKISLANKRECQLSPPTIGWPVCRNIRSS